MKNKKRYLFTSDFMYFVPLLIAAIVMFGQVYCWFDDPARFASIGSLHVGVLTLTASVLLAAVTEAHMFVIVNDVVFAYNPRIAVMQPFSEDSLRELIGKTGTIFGDAPLSRVSDSPRSYFLRIAFYTVVCFAVVMSVGELAGVIHAAKDIADLRPRFWVSCYLILADMVFVSFLVLKRGCLRFFWCCLKGPRREILEKEVGDRIRCRYHMAMMTILTLSVWLGMLLAVFTPK